MNNIFSSNEFERRMIKTKKNMQKRDLDVLFVYDPSAIYFLSGYCRMLMSGNALGVVIPISGEPLLIAPFVEYPTAKFESWIKDVRPYLAYDLKMQKETKIKKMPIEVGKNKLIELNLLKKDTTIGLEGASHSEFHTALKNFPNAKIINTSGMIEQIALIKSTEELELIRHSAKIADLLVDEAWSVLRNNITEFEVAKVIAKIIFENGCIAKQIVVTSGSRLFLPHGLPTKRKIKKGDLIRIDIGVLTNWYLAEIARTIVFGKATGKVKRMHSALIKSQEEAIKTIMPNVRSFEIDSVARNSLRADGFADYYIHSTGHGLNLVNYWQPTLSAVDNTLIRPNMALSIEPGIYMEKASSVHVEDAVIVNDDGVEVLTKYPHELEIT